MERLQLWLPRGGDQARRSMLPPDADALHDAFKHPHAERPSLPPGDRGSPGQPAGPPSYPDPKSKIH